MGKRVINSEVGFAFVGLCIAIAQGAISRYFSKRWDSAKILRFSILLLGVTFLFLLLPKNSAYLYTVIPFIAIFQGLTYPNITALVSNLSAKDSQGEILGINQSIQSLAQSIPPIIAGLISSISINLPIITASIITILAWVVFVWLYAEKNEELFHEV